MSDNGIPVTTERVQAADTIDLIECARDLLEEALRRAETGDNQRVTWRIGDALAGCDRALTNAGCQR